MENRDERGQFAPKYKTNKKRCDFRLSPVAIAELETWSHSIGCSKTDVIEYFLQGNLDEAIVLRALLRFVCEQQKKAGGNQHKKAGQLDLNSVHWRKLNEFKRWVENE